MAMMQDITGSTEAAIIARMIHAEKADLPKGTAQAVLRLFSLDQADLDRMHILAVKNQDDAPHPPKKPSLRTTFASATSSTLCTPRHAYRSVPGTRRP